MNVVVVIPYPMRRYVDGLGQIKVKGGTVDEVISNLEGMFRGLRENLRDIEGNLLPFIGVFINDQDIRDLARLDTKLKDDDRLFFTVPLAGGTQSNTTKITWNCL